MHCFVVAWKLPEKFRHRLEPSLAALTDVYETLDASSLWSRQQGSLSVASIQSSPAHRGARCYRAINPSGFTLVDGLCVDLQGEFSAFDAAQLAQHWSRIPASVDGQFILVRGQQEPAQLEIITDSLGVLQLYCARTGSGWVLSNSVQVLKNLLELNEPDPQGTASYLSIGWSVANSTLVRGIECVPGGQHWRWQAAQDKPRRDTYFGRGNLARTGQRRLPPEAIAALGQTLLDTVRPIGALAEVECPITAGKDSRLMAAVLAEAKVPAIYFASGREGEPDMEMGRQFAERFQLPFRALDDFASATDAEWEDAIWRLVKQTDGMSTLAHVSTALRGNDPSPVRCVHLYGAGGEIGRANFFQRKALYYLLPLGHEGAKRALRDLMMTYRGNLVRPEAEALATQYLDQFVDHMRDDGFASSELEALFYMEERVRRWAGNNFRQLDSYRDVFTPYCTRAYAQASFSVPLLYRYADHIHYELLGYLDREMQQFPLEVPWYAQRPLPLTVQLLTRYYDQSGIARLSHRVLNRIQRLHVAATRWNKRAAWNVAPSRRNERASWLEQFLPRLRQRVLDQSSSALWDYVDRPRLEHLLDPGTPAVERRRCQPALFDTLTLFHYNLACAPRTATSDPADFGKRRTGQA
jgi:asparagine synthase (glutamine-hydrolysing)